MKRFAAVLAIGVALAAGAASAQDMMASAYANTIIVTDASGVALRYHFNADGSFDIATPDGHAVNGAYTVANGQICLTPAGGQAACTEYVGEKNVGDTWTQAATDGGQITVSIVAGRP